MRRKHKKIQQSPDLDITPFMNLMIVLVPVLLLGMVFSQIKMIELNFPGEGSASTEEMQDWQLVVALVPSGLELSESRRGVLKSLPLVEGKQDFTGLREALKQIKQRVPEKRDIVLEVGPEVDYQTLVTAMDTIRSYPAVVAASVVEGELFPEVSLSDAPEGRLLESGSVEEGA